MSIDVFVRVVPDIIRSEHDDITQEVIAFMLNRLTALAGFSWTRISESKDATSGGVLVELSTKAPLFDEELLANMVHRASRTNSRVQAEGACPGTAPLLVVRINDDGTQAARLTTLQHTRHPSHNSQLSLHKLKRLKIFLALRSAHPDLHAWPISKVLEFFGSQEGTEFAISYGGAVALETLSACPNCQSTEIDDVRVGNGQPVIGFLTRHSRYYSRCAECQLVFLNPTVREDDISKLYDWYDLEFDVYSEKIFTPLALQEQNAYGPHHRALFQHLRTAETNEPLRVLDVGGGTGRFSAYVQQEFPNAQVSLVDFRIAGKSDLIRRGIKCVEGDVLHVEYPKGGFDLITMWEVIEHFRYERLSELFAQLEQWLAPGGRLVFSTPNMAAQLCRAIDFWAWFAPHHLTVLSPRHAHAIAENCGLEVEVILADSVIMGPNRTDLDYAASAHSSASARSEAGMLRDLAKLSDANRDFLRSTDYGSEMICILRKADS